MKIYLEYHKILVKDYYTTHHNNALTITLHKNMSFPLPKDVNYILPKMNSHTSLSIPKKPTPTMTSPPHLSKSMAHIHTPSGTILGSTTREQGF